MKHILAIKFFFFRKNVIVPERVKSGACGTAYLHSVAGARGSAEATSPVASFSIMKIWSPVNLYIES